MPRLGSFESARIGDRALLHLEHRTLERIDKGLIGALRCVKDGSSLLTSKPKHPRAKEGRKKRHSRREGPLGRQTATRLGEEENAFGEVASDAFKWQSLLTQSELDATRLCKFVQHQLL